MAQILPDIVAPGGGTIKMNTAMGQALPDVDAEPGPLVAEMRALVGELQRRALTPDLYLGAVAALYRRRDPVQALAPWIERALAERKDQVLWRKAEPGRSQFIQLLYLEPREVHPPHCHHNLISLQYVLNGRVHIREYDRVARLGPETLLLRIRKDGWFGRGGMMDTSEVHKNAHWFAADENPAVILNFYILGFQEWTFDPPESSRKGRKMLDPTGPAQGDGLIVAREIPLEDGYRKFGNRPLADFPQPPC